jgi:hypothetical protein
LQRTRPSPEREGVARETKSPLPLCVHVCDDDKENQAQV